MTIVASRDVNLSPEKELQARWVDDQMPQIDLVSGAVATLLSLHGFRRKSLSPSGAIAAFFVGSVMMAGPLRTFGICLIVLYLIGSRATKYGKQHKATYEEGYHEAGYRTAWQVFCNSFAAFIAAVLWKALFVPDSLSSILLGTLYSVETLPYNGNEWCPLSETVANGASRALIFAALGHFSCCLGDTLASELGILSQNPPMLITTFKRVPRGTNGAISAEGTRASIIGGLAMGVTLALSVFAENSKCREEWLEHFVMLVSWGIAGGVCGSLIDSLLGATVQRTRYSTESKRILQDGPESRASADIKVISGLDLLTNNQVNLMSSILTAVILAKVG